MVSSSGDHAPGPEQGPGNITVDDGDITQADIRMGNSSDTFFSDIEINSDEEHQTGGILNGGQLDLSGDNSLLLSLAAPETPFRAPQSDNASTQAPLQDLSTQARTILERHKHVVLEADHSSWSDHVPDDVQVMGTPIDREYDRPKLVPRPRPVHQVDSDGEDTAFIEETPFKSPPFKHRKLLLPEPRAIGTPLRGARPKNTIPATPPQDQCLFFYWPGDGWYPALILDRDEYHQAKNDPKRQIVVEFGTEEEGQVKASLAVPIDLQIGDLVRYDNMQYKISAMSESSTPQKFVTSAGFDTLTIDPVRVSRRMQLETVTVAVKDISMRDREFQQWNTSRLNRLATQRSLYAAPPSMTSLAPPLTSLAPAAGIFKNCMFLVTMANHDNAKSIEGSILDNFGVVVEDFEQIIDVQPAVSWKADPSFTFGAVIATRPLRSPKYLGGLAMGWPCLSFKFISDCVSAGRFLENWKDYLLAAGDSLALDSPISLDITDFYQRWASGCSLKTQFDQRQLAMGGLVPPLYLVQNTKDNIVQLLVQLSCARPPRIVSGLDEITEEGVVVILAKLSSLSSEHPSISPKDIVLRLSKQLMLPKTVIYSRDWLIQCIINRRLV